MFVSSRVYLELNLMMHLDVVLVLGLHQLDLVLGVVLERIAQLMRAVLHVCARHVKVELVRVALEHFSLEILDHITLLLKVSAQINTQDTKST